MKIKISGIGSIAGYTVLNEDDLDWLCSHLGANPTDNELKDFCEDDRIWEEIHFKFKLSGPSVYAKVFIDNTPISSSIESNSPNTLPKLTNMTGNDGILTVIKDYRGIWFNGTINSNSFDIHKLEFETTFISGAELITKVLYNKKEILNEISEPLVTNYNTYASLTF